jgi:membrane protein insertase Oxa1/YidC/SpoIIIJ
MYEYDSIRVHFVLRMLRPTTTLQATSAATRRVQPSGRKETAQMQELSNSAAFWMLIVMVLTVLFFLPTLIGLIRGVDGLAVVFLVNLIGAPVLIGWPAALILAFGPRRPGTATARRCREPFYMSSRRRS